MALACYISFDKLVLVFVFIYLSFFIVFNFNLFNKLDFNYFFFNSKAFFLLLRI